MWSQRKLAWQNGPENIYDPIAAVCLFTCLSSFFLFKLPPQPTIPYSEVGHAKSQICYKSLDWGVGLCVYDTSSLLSILSTAATRKFITPNDFIPQVWALCNKPLVSGNGTTELMLLLKEPLIVHLQTATLHFRFVTIYRQAVWAADLFTTCLCESSPFSWQTL